MLVSIDPGTDACGIAIWNHDKTLRSADIVQVKQYVPGASGRAQMAAGLSEHIARELGHDIYQVVIEFPRTYGGRAAKGDTNDLLSLAATVGAIAQEIKGFGNVHQVTPPEWKGQVPKPQRAGQRYIIGERCRSLLSLDEKARVRLPRSARLQWDVWDAVGIGLWFLDRMP